MNMHSDLSGKMQYDYYMETIRKRKRFSKWIKNEITDDLQLVMDEFKCSAPKAKNILPLLSDEYISHLKDLNVQKT